LTTSKSNPVAAPEASVAGNPVLAVRGLSVRSAECTLVQDVDLTINPGERVGLIGESGSGKSLTATAIMGLLSDELTAAGSVRLANVGHDLISASERQMSHVRGRHLAMVFQEPMTALNPLMRIGRQVSEVMLLHGTQPDRRSADAAAVELLAQVRLPDPAAAARAYPHQLSGGQRQRVVLAIALANDPAVLLCDEPTTALDVTVQAQMLDLILDGVRERHAGLLFITHDLAVIARVCERVLVMYGGRVVEAGTVAEVLTAPRHPYTQGLLAASDLEDLDERGRLRTIPGSVPPAGEFPAGCVFRNRCSHATAECETAPGGPGRKKRASPASIPFRSPRMSEVFNEAGSGQTSALVSVRDLHRTYRSPRDRAWRRAPGIPALKGISFDVRAGERFGVVGESGSGKSTLIRLLAGLDHATSGSIRIDGHEIVRATEKQLRFLRSNLQIVFQDPMSALDPRMRVRDIIAEPLVAQGGTGVTARVREVLDAVGLPGTAIDRFPHQFSGGQRQRIAIARALVARPKIVVADEPVSALDVSVRAQILNLLADLVEELSLTLVFVSHDLAVIRHVCDTVAVIRHGEIVECGPTADVYEAPGHAYTRDLVAASPTLRAALPDAGQGSR
jgi:peptide/nickel transport system ATP-binding protein